MFQHNDTKGTRGSGVNNYRVTKTSCKPRSSRLVIMLLVCLQLSASNFLYSSSCRHMGDGPYYNDNENSMYVRTACCSNKHGGPGAGQLERLSPVGGCSRGSCAARTGCGGLPCRPLRRVPLAPLDLLLEAATTQSGGLVPIRRAGQLIDVCGQHADDLAARAQLAADALPAAGVTVRQQA